mmetsp:Transcript_7885/g.20030  ORF Transcript_7885/g.20030 Transcript_7885/m.20030 type:complete len:233 (+) Transcript_7885:429-1127(+)
MLRRMPLPSTAMPLPLRGLRCRQAAARRLAWHRQRQYQRWYRRTHQSTTRLGGLVAHVRGLRRTGMKTTSTVMTMTQATASVRSMSKSCLTNFPTSSSGQETRRVRLLLAVCLQGQLLMSCLRARLRRTHLTLRPPRPSQRLQHLCSWGAAGRRRRGRAQIRPGEVSPLQLPQACCLKIHRSSTSARARQPLAQPGRRAPLRLQRAAANRPRPPRRRRCNAASARSQKQSRR